MDLEIKYCPGTLVEGYNTYSRTCLKRVFNDKKVHHLLPYKSPATDEETDNLFVENRKRMSISGVQEKFSILLEKNKIRLISEGERGTYILKPIPNVGKNKEFMPANEHLTMQIAKQVFNIETAENAMIFFSDGKPAYITKRFDVKDGVKLAKEDFASLAGRTPQTHGEDYKYLGNYFELFQLLKKYVPAYITEAPKLYKLIVFNYLFSNGDAHFKNFSLIETKMGDYKLSPAYDLLNSQIHIEDRDFALEGGLIPYQLKKGKVKNHFMILADYAGINQKTLDRIMDEMLSGTEKVIKLIEASFLSDKLKRNYLQAYQTRIKKVL
ncbi:MAG: HipA domain-containing protein [Bacteroidales bacterium]|nr:HipA domain-containing protein [Bacteroidales bacterium]